MDREFEGKTVFITGASSGIGRSTALEFAKLGSRVVLADIDDQKGTESADAIIKAGGKALFLHCDVSREEEVIKAIKKTVEHYGSLDCAFNNAGIEGEQARTHECTMENWKQVININLGGVFKCMKYQLPQMLKQKKGVIVNCSSIAGKVGFPGLPAYEASKHGVIGLTKNASLEYAKENIRINAVCPGPIETPMIERFTKKEPSMRDQLTTPDPMGRMGKPAEIANAVVWLCSEKASYVTGHSMLIDGGWVAQ